MTMLKKSSLLVFLAAMSVLASAQGARRVAVGDWP
jgi:hypothetical protein